MAAYAGAGLANANPFSSGVNAVKLAIAAFIIPYIFVSNPILVLEGATASNLIPAIITALIGMGAISAAIMGYFIGPANIVERLALVAGGLLLVYPELLISLTGLAVVIGIGVFQYMRGKAGGKPGPEETEEQTEESNA